MELTRPAATHAGIARSAATLKALISDIHGNLEGSTRSSRTFSNRMSPRNLLSRGCHRLRAQSAECIDLVMQCKVVLLGNHDQGHVRPRRLQSAGGASDFLDARPAGGGRRIQGGQGKKVGFPGRKAAPFQRKRLSLRAWLCANPLNEYVFPEDIYNQRKMDRIFALVDRYCFQGHTHVPGIFTVGRNEDVYQFQGPEEIDYVHKLDEQDIVQCRLRRPAARWRLASLLRPFGWRFHSLSSDRVRNRQNRQEIYDIPDLDNFLGDRLRDGRVRLARWAVGKRVTLFPNWFRLFRLRNTYRKM